MSSILKKQGNSTVSTVFIYIFLVAILVLMIIIYILLKNLTKGEILESEEEYAGTPSPCPSDKILIGDSCKATSSSGAINDCNSSCRQNGGTGLGTCKYQSYGSGVQTYYACTTCNCCSSASNCPTPSSPTPTPTPTPSPSCPSKPTCTGNTDKLITMEGISTAPFPGNCARYSCVSSTDQKAIDDCSNSCGAKGGKCTVSGINNNDYFVCQPCKCCRNASDCQTLSSPSNSPTRSRSPSPSPFMS